MIKDFELFHGLVFSRLLHATGSRITIRLLQGLSNSAYVVDESIGLYIKYSTKRLSPWSFSFNRTHLNEIVQMKTEWTKLVVALVCGKDGIATLTFDEFRTVLGDRFKETGWITVSRRKREMYGIKGSAGELKYKIADNDGATKIISIADSNSNQ